MINAITPYQFSVAITPNEPSSLQNEESIRDLILISVKKQVNSEPDYQNSAFKLYEIFTETFDKHLRDTFCVPALQIIYNSGLAGKMPPNSVKSISNLALNFSAESYPLSFVAANEILAEFLDSCVPSRYKKSAVASAVLANPTLFEVDNLDLLSHFEARIVAELDQSPHPRHLTPLIRILLKTFAALSTILPESLKSNSKILPHLIRFLHHRDPAVRICVIEALLGFVLAKELADESLIQRLIMPALVAMIPEGDCEQKRPLLSLSLEDLAIKVASSENSMKCVSFRAPMVLSRFLMAKSELINSIVMSSDVLQRLCNLICHNSVLNIYKKDALNCIGLLCADRDDVALKALSFNVIPSIVTALESNEPDLKISAADALRRMTRSVKLMRSISEGQRIARALAISVDNEAISSTSTATLSTPNEAAAFNEMPIPMLKSSNISLKSSAAAVLCNLVLEFSPVKNFLLEPDASSGLPTTDLLANLAALALDSTVPEALSINATWALRNCVYEASRPVREYVANQLSKDGIVYLLHHSENSIAVLGAALLRNLVWHSSREMDVNQGLPSAAAETISFVIDDLVALCPIFMAGNTQIAERIEHLLGVIHNVYSFKVFTVKAVCDASYPAKLSASLASYILCSEISVAGAAVRSTWNIFRSLEINERKSVLSEAISALKKLVEGEKDAELRGLASQILDRMNL